MFTYDDPEQGRRVLNVAVPMSARGRRGPPTWDTLGMRGTASDDVVFDDVFVPDDQVLANRPYGVVDAPLQVISDIAFTDHLRRLPRGRRRGATRRPATPRAAGPTTCSCSARSG